MRTCSPRSFTIYNHNRYDVIERGSYDEYNMLINIADFLESDSMRQKLIILAHLAHEVCDDIAQHVELHMNFKLGRYTDTQSCTLYVYEPERSAMVKLTYS